MGEVREVGQSTQFDTRGDSDRQVLSEDGARVFCRVWRLGADGEREPVLTVLPTAEHPPLATLTRLAHECGLKEELDGAWAARPLKLVHERGRTMLVLEDPGGEPLERLLDEPIETGRFLRLAIGIVTALGKAHQRGLVHKDVKPANILVNCADEHVRLTGFGLASRLLRERQAPEPPEFIAGTLAYMAPEQTGRMNRSIDSRSDLYALGITLYQMLTGTLPFTAADPMEWVHCHIARRPAPPSERLESVPAALSAIIMKLLAKFPEERYQTAAGIERDLRRCLAQWESRGGIDPFPLGELDTPDRLLIPEKLYGREREVEALLASFDRVVRSGTPELVLVSGYSGIGKSSLVNELHKVLVPPRGLFASGKFDQYKRDIPYSTLAQAFQTLVRSLLSKSDAELARWRHALLEALGRNGCLMTALIPALKFIIGDQPPIPEFEPQQAQARFQLVFRRFINVFARSEHPLALFLDDLQWLDAATLELLENLLTRSDLQHLMLIGAYRDNEVTAAHPLMRKLDVIKSAGAKVVEITLAPLAPKYLGKFIADTLRCEPARAAPLAQVVHEKTGGNPFFAIQFLFSFAEEGLLAFDHEAANWSWDLDRVHAKEYTDNVVDLMAGKLARLPKEARDPLQQLSCLGAAAPLTTLSIVLGMSEEQVHAAFWTPVRQGFVERLAGAYRFLHDRIHEAAYALIPEASRAETHLHIGRLLAAHTPPEKREEAIFDIVNQLNRGAALIANRDEREQLAKLNLIAGKRAKASAAYGSALTYLVAGASLLAEDRWARHQELTFALKLYRAECEFLIGQLAIAEERLNVLSIRATNAVERASVACLRVDLYTTLGQSSRAISVGLDYLRHLGVDWSPHPTEEEARREYQRIWSQLGNRTIEELRDLPLMTDSASLATVDVLTKLEPAALFTDANLYSLIIYRAVNLSIEHGNCDGSCFAYVRLGLDAGARFSDYRAGFRFGSLGYDLVEQHGLTRFQARTYMLFGAHVMPGTRHVRTGRDLLHRAFDVANKTGDRIFAGYSCFNLTENLLAAGDPLLEVQREAEHGLAFARGVQFEQVADVITSQLALVRMLRGLTRKFGSFDHEHFDEIQTERRFSNDPDLAFAECCYWIQKLQAHYYAGNYTAAIEAASRAQRHTLSGVLFFAAHFHFYSALSRAACCDAVIDGPQQQHADALASHHKQLQVLAENCPENFENRAALVGAEIARIEGRAFDAMGLYERAIRSARANGFVHNEALANELAARFYAARGFETISHTYLRNARYCYLRWGADGKLRQLDQTYPELKDEPPVAGPTSTIGTLVEHLDLATVIKVSQAISGEVVLEKLIDTLMRTAIEQAGAERGLLILGQGAEQRVAAEAMTSGNTVSVELRDDALAGASLPESMVQYTLRACESVILDDASVANAFSADPYFQQRYSRSILCLPLLTQANLIGAIYLENNLAPGVFAPARIAVLKLLISHAAVSLQNSRLYRDLADREGKIRRLVDANVIGVFFWNIEGQVVEANDAFLRMLGYDREDLASGRVHRTDLTPPEWRDRDARTVTELKLRGTVQPFEKEYFRKDGGRVPVLIGFAAFDQGRDRGVAFVVDLSEHKRAEEALRQSEERFRTLVQFSFDVYWETDAQHRFIHQEFAEGLSDAPAGGSEIGKTCWEVPYLEPEEEAWRQHRATLDAHLPFRDFELARPAPDGGKRYVSMSGLPVFDEKGRFIGYRGVGRHITERKRAEEVLRRDQAYLAEAQRLSQTGSWTVSAATRTITHWSAQQYRLEGIDPAGGVPSLEEHCRRVHPDDLPRCFESFERAISRGAGYELDYRVIHPDGTIRHLHSVAHPVFNAAGELVEMFGTNVDITERKRAEEERRESERRYHELEMELVRANRVATMGQLTASIAHEVSQPLAAARNNASAALRFLNRSPPDLEEVRQALSCVVNDTDRAGDIVGRIREHIKKAPPRKVNLDINDAITEVIAFARSEAVKNGVAVQTHLMEGLSPVEGDRVQLQQVVLNLILNAVEAMTSVGGGSRELSICTERSQTGEVIVAVRDSGPGMDPEDFERVFESFYTTKSSGMGMGLSICRSIVDAHGGRIWVEANEPQGAAFRFALPMAQTDS